MFQVGVCGHFALDINLLNGQTVKTKIITDELKAALGSNNVYIVDTYGWKKNPLILFANCCKLIKKCRNVIILPASNGIKVFVPLFNILNKIYKRKLHYVVIGGWLPDLLKNNIKLQRWLSNFDGIYVETNYLVKSLNNLGLINVRKLPNFKKLKILEKNELIYNNKEPYKLCTFSRIMKEKGIEDAINAVKHINEKYHRIIYTLDIYGQIEENYIENFKILCNKFPSYIRYRGTVPFDKSVEILKEYFALLFPTHFATEGIPGTIIDAYCAGLPIISSKWNSFSDIIDDYKTGIGFELNNIDELICILQNIANDPSKLYEMKENCLKKASDYLPQSVIPYFISFLN